MPHFHNCEQQQKIPRLCIEGYDSQRNALYAKIRTCLHVTLYINSVFMFAPCISDIQTLYYPTYAQVYTYVIRRYN